jgi:RNA polymerase sigma-70 factor, ECF subfamily
MVDAPDDEARIVKLAMAGDFDAFAALYTCYLDPIYRYIYYRIGDLQDAEDFTEQVFIKAWEALPVYKPVGSLFINWLYRIAHNIVVDHHRRQKRIVFESLPSHADLPAPAEEPALEAIIQGEEKSVLSAAIGKLPEDYQQVIILRFIEGLGHQEIAQVLDKSEGACRGLQHRALLLLNKILAGMREWN